MNDNFVKLYHGDNVAVMKHLARNGTKANLAYADPPFNTGRDFITRDGKFAYCDKWVDLDEYIEMLRLRCLLMRTLMVDNGCVVLHCDARVSHRVRVMLDDVFGANHFQGEIIWCLGTGAKGMKRPSLQHNTLFVYSLGDHVTFNTSAKIMREPYAFASVATHFRDVDSSGRRCRKRTINNKEYVYYADDGRLVGSVWTDIPAMVATSPIMSESTGYPTQKPERLLERIITAFSNVGDVVIDPFMGSGTTLAVARRLSRNSIGIDSSMTAIVVASNRLGQCATAWTSDE